MPEVGPTVLIEAAAAHNPAPSASGLPYQQDPEATNPAVNPAGDQVIATAIPYFQWDNRDGRAMRVWSRRPLAPASAAPITKPVYPRSLSTADPLSRATRPRPPDLPTPTSRLRITP